jgi:ABC-type sugar transport system ATPase subunit
MGDRIAVLRGGVLQQIGAPREIYEDPANEFVAGFLGSPPINWIDVKRDGDRLEGAGAVLPAPAGIALPAQVKAGVRPEHLHFNEAPAGKVRVAIDALVTAAEPLGAETHLLLDAAGTRLRAKTAGFDAPARGEGVRLYVDPLSILWFDGRSGARLGRGS